MNKTVRDSYIRHGIGIVSGILIGSEIDAATLQQLQILAVDIFDHVGAVIGLGGSAGAIIMSLREKDRRE